VSKVVASELNTLVLFSNNTIRIAGSNHTGMLLNGNFTSTTIVNEPNISTFRSTATVVDIGASYTTGYILLSDGRIGLWGSNGTGQLGNGNTNNSNTLVTITSVTLSLGVGEKVISVATGKNHTVAITDNQKIFFWGRNSNFAVGTAVAENNQRLSPFNISSWFYTLQLTNGDPYFGFSDQYDEVGSRPVQVYAGNDSTVFKLIMIRREYNYVTETPGPITAYPEESYYEALGLNNNNGSGFVLSDTSQLTLQEPNYIGFESWDWDNSSAIHVSFSETNVAIVNNENDFTLHGSNTYGQMGLGNTSIDEDDISNYSYDFRYFEEFVYPNLPVEFAAPLDDQFETLTPDQNYAIQDSIGVYFSNEFFSDKERTLVTEDQWNHMREIFAEFFEDQVLYGWVPATNDALLTYVQDNLEERYWLREDMEAMANYQSWSFAEWANAEDVITLDQSIVDLLDPEVETRLDQFRSILAKIQTFENDVLQPFVQELRTLNTDDLSYTYLDEDEEVWLDLSFDQIEQLIALGYTDDILAIFDAYDELSELEQLLLTERHDSNYFELYYDYYEYFAEVYANSLADFEYDVQEEEWDWYWPLFENLAELETLLDGINDLNAISYEFFVETYGQEDEFFAYGMYEYWIYLNDLVPFLKEGKDVFDQVVLVEDLIQFVEGTAYLDLDDVEAVLDMYADYLLLSEEAQELLDPEYISYLYSLALETLANEVDDLAYDIYSIEDEEGVYGLFASYDDILAALAKFEALPEDALEYLSEEALEYYAYLLSIKLPMEEGLDVFNQIEEIDALDLDNLNDETIEAISDMYVDYLALSEEAKSLLDPEYVDYLVSLVTDHVENSVNSIADSIEEFDTLYNDEDIREDLVSNLLDAYNTYNDLPEDVKDLIDIETREQLEAFHARYLVLSQPKSDIGMIGLILVHLTAGAYFVYKKRKIIGVFSK
jgi:hypothetical protein